jgi:hypothetical protein
MDDIRITPFMLKALRWIEEREDKDMPWGCKWFAMAMWGDSPAWKRHYKIGHGTTIGKGMWLCAGSYLAKLEDKKLLDSHWKGYTRQYYLTMLAVKILDNNRDKENDK